MATLPEDIVAELIYRISADTAHFEGNLPERTAICWRGYLAGMLEWGLLEPHQYDAVLAHVPEVDQDPAIGLLKGR